MKLWKLCLPGLFLILGSCNEDNAYTLYRDSLLDKNMRIHIATFDSIDGIKIASYNSENCNLARDLFASQDGVKTKFWCEKGRYKE